MVLGAYNDNLYNAFLALHILSVLVAFAPGAAHPATMARYRADGAPAMARLAGAMAANTRAVYLPALIAVGVFGAVLVLLSGDSWSFGDTWVVGGILAWVVACGIVSGMILPAEKALAAGDESAEKRIAMGGQLATIALIVLLWLMVFKPGV